MIEPWYNPAIFSLGFISIRWFGFLLVVGFVLAALITRKMFEREKLNLSREQLDSLCLHLLLGMLVGGRLWYVLFYNSNFYFSHFWQIFAIWKGGLSFHGALVGAIIALRKFAWRNRQSFFTLADALALAATPLIFFGKIGNFINGEAYGRITDSFMGIIIPLAGTVPRHPVQLYEAFLLGPVLFLILWNVEKRKKFAGVTAGFFLLAYGFLRLLAECFREADPQIGYFVGIFTMGQLFCVLMIACGIGLLKLSKLKKDLLNPTF